MSTETQEEYQGTKPIPEHDWLNNLVGEWRVESTMIMGMEGEEAKCEGKETVTSLGGLFAYLEGEGPMPDGSILQYKGALGYDVSFKEYRYVWISNVSSHIWNYVCTLSDDGMKLTMDCEGPDMVKDGETANYRDVIEIIDKDNRTYTSSGQDGEGKWHQYMKAHYYRIK